MASGDSLIIFTAQGGVPTATAGAQPTTIDGASTPAEVVPILAFDPGAADEHADFYGIMPQHYDDSGFTVVITFGAATDTGDVHFGVAFRAIEDDAEDLDTTAHTYVYNEETATVPSDVGELTQVSIAFADGADMDNVDAGDPFIMRVRREASDDGNDTAVGDMHLFSAEIREA